MAKTKLNIIKPSLGFAQMPDADLLSRLNAVHDGLSGNAAYPSPPVDLANFKSAIDAYTAAVAATLDGGKSATVERDKRRTDAIIMLRLLAHYVEGACNNDMTTFVSSGLAAASPVARTPSQPVSPPSIVRIDQGNSGQLIITSEPVTGARLYELRRAADPGAGGTVTWTTTVVPSTRPPIAINDLTPGVKYTFQVRAFGKLGFSDWSSPVERMCI